MITAQKLKSLFRYDPDTGHFFRLVKVKSSARGNVGDIAGSNNGRIGYWRICIEWRLYLAHCLAWLYMTGEWPAGFIDHINMVNDDNRWTNLRLATNSQNKANNAGYANNKSGFKGVYWHKRDQKWVACLRVQGHLISLGYHNRAEDASAAYQKAAAVHFGEFAR